TNIYFSEIYRKWYKNGSKVIHDDIWKINNLGLATIFFDDGYKEGSGYGIALDSYSEEDIKKLKSVFREKFDLSCTAPKRGRSIYIKKESADHFKELIKQMLVKGMEYKLESCINRVNCWKAEMPIRSQAAEGYAKGSTTRRIPLEQR